MILQCLTTSFKQQLLEGVHDFRTTGDVFKIALYSETATLNSSTTAYSTDFEVTGPGYTAGGATLTNVDPSAYGTTAFATFATVSWPASSISNARGALIYNTTPAHTYTNPSVMVLDFGLPRFSQSDTFDISFPTFNSQYALIRLDAS